MNTLDRFIGYAAWAGLTKAEQDEIGTIALELVSAWYAHENAESEPLARAAERAEFELEQSLQEAFCDAVPRSSIDIAAGVPRLPSRLGPVCRECGCSQSDACTPACSWVEKDLCSACKPPTGTGA